jgi:transcriptional regulator with XRE-family HTH domain
MSSATQEVGVLLRQWRKRRRLSQLDLACEAEISQRHLSFLESGRSSPSRDMLLRLAEQLAVPLRERNALLVAAGFAPVYGERALDDPALGAARAAVNLILAAQDPYPALAVDRHWTLLAANTAATHLMAGVDPKLGQPPVNVLRLSLHPDGLGPRICNFRQWRAHVLARLMKQIENSADPVLMALMDELKAYPIPAASNAWSAAGPHDFAGIVVPLELTTDSGVLSFFSTTTIFGTPLDISLSELAIESFFPADSATAEAMRRVAGQPPSVRQ